MTTFLATIGLVSRLTPALRATEGLRMLFFGRKKRLIDYASCAG